MQTTYNIAHTHLKKNPFSVPDGYFDLLPQQIGQKIARISTEQTHGAYSGSPVFKRLSAQLALAASFVLMIGLGYGLIRLITPKSVDSDPFDAAPISVFKTYTLLQNDEWEDPIDSEQIITFLTERGISPLAVVSFD